MRGRVAAAVLLSLSLSSPVIPQCIPARASFPFRSTVFDLAIEGNDLWLASGYGVELLERTIDPPMPRLAIALPGMTRVVRVSRGVVYAASDDRLFVLRRAANTLQIVRSITARGTINDLAVGTHLYLATSKGIEQFDLVDPLAPKATTSSFATSSENVQSLTISGTSLYAADGDSTVEVFSIAAPTSPVGIATLQTLPRAIAVHIARDRVYVSDGQNTEVFLGQSAKASARFAYGSTSFATIEGDEHFVAGTDRAVRAVDFSVGNRPVERFEVLLPPHGGTINRVFAMQRAGDRLYVAAGDIGLVSFDTASFLRPYGIANYRTGATTSVAFGGLLVAGPATGMTEYSLDPAGMSLAVVKTTPATEVEKIYAGFTSRGKTARRYPPVGPHLWTATYDSNVQTVVGSGSRIIALLENGTVRASDWTDLSGGPGSKLNFGGRTATHLVGSATVTFVVGSVTAEGKTELLMFGLPLDKPERTITIDGAANGNIAVRTVGDSITAALYTYRGINLVDLTTGSVTVLPQSDEQLVTQLHFAGSEELLATTDQSLTVWDLAKRRIVREIALPSEPVALDSGAVAGVAIIATRDGVTAVRYRNPGMPEATTPRNANRYYSRIAAAAGRLYLADDDGVDVYSTAFDYTPHYIGTVATSGLAAIAAADDALFTLSTSGVVRGYTRDGVLLRERSVHDGSSDWQPLAMFAVGGAPWIAYSRGCSTTECQQSTAVLDPLSLATTTTLPGAVIDVTATATRTAALFKSPDELRTYNLADPTRPAKLASAGMPGMRAIAAGPDRIYALGFRLATYFDDLFWSNFNIVYQWEPEPWHERLRVVGDCALLMGKRAVLDSRPVQFKSISGPPSLIELPSIVRGSAVSGSRVFVLTDHSLEVFDSAPATTLPKRRAVR